MIRHLHIPPVAALVVPALLLPLAPSAKASDYVGTTAGSAYVSNAGGAGYSVPLQVPPGTGGLEPKLSLDYDSSQGDGYVGLRWTLSGLSAISRCPATVAQDSFKGGLRYDDQDRLCLDGTRLIPVGTSGDEYRTEIESWKKVVSEGDSGADSDTTATGNGPRSFTVQTRDGRTLSYGGTDDSRVAAVGSEAVRVWALDSITDHNGNSMNFTYEVDSTNGAYYPVEIDYTANGSFAASRQVTFDYESRDDLVPSWIGGSIVLTDQRLTAVSTRVDGALVRTYSLAYEADADRSLLASITESDADGKSLPATSFSWQPGPDSEYGDSVASSFTAPSGGTFLPMDIDGNGRQDFVYAGSDNSKLTLSIGISNADDGSWSGFDVTEVTTDLYWGGQFFPMDYNADGDTDLVYATKTNDDLSLNLFASDGSTLSLEGCSPAAPGLSYGGVLNSGDIDGDGSADLVYATKQNDLLALTALLSDGSCTGFSTPVEIDLDDAPLYGGGIFQFDVDGDGMSDVVYTSSNNDKLELQPFLSRWDSSQQAWSGFETGPATSSDLPYGGMLISVDLHGDGRNDAVYLNDVSGSVGLTLFVADGSGFQNGSDVTPTNPPLWGGSLLPMDVDGDGLQDLVYSGDDSGKASFTLFRSNGQGLEAAKDLALTDPPYWGGSILPTDADGDGKTDIVYTSASGSTFSVATWPANGPMANLMTGITNGLGGQVTFSYAPLSDPSVYAKESPSSNQVGAAAGLRGVAGSVYDSSSASSGEVTGGSPGTARAIMVYTSPSYVVSQMTKDDGINDPFIYDYSYSHGAIGLTGRGWLGFATRSVVDENLETATATSWSQDFPLTNQVVQRTVSRSTDGALMRVESFDFDTPTTNPGVYLVNRTAKGVEHYTYGTVDLTLVTDFEFDDYGNVSKRTYWGEEGQAPLYECSIYLNDEESWHIGYLSDHKFAADDDCDGDVLKWSQRQYDDDWNLEVEQRWDDNQQIWLTDTYTYDAFGNKTSRTNVAGDVMSWTYEKTYNTFRETETTPANQNGDTLTTTYAYDAGFGVMTAKTDANNVESTYLLDGLGRVTGTYGPDPSGDSVQLSTEEWDSDSDGAYVERTAILDWKGSTSTWSRAYRDGFSRVWQRLKQGPETDQVVVVTKTLDSDGRTLSRTEPYFDGDDSVATTWGYDNYGRPIQQVRPDGSGGTITTTYSYPAYDQAKISTTDPTDSTVRTVSLEFAWYNDKRKLVQRTDGDGGVATFDYDVLGRTISTVDPAGVRDDIELDSSDRRTALSESITDNGTTTELLSWSWAFDDQARTETRTDGAGNQIVTTYDGLHRKLSQSDGTSTYEWSWDDASADNSQGRLSAVELPSSATYAYGYDEYGNKSDLEFSGGGAKVSISASYGPTRKPTGVSYGDMTLEATYTADDRLATQTVVASDSTTVLAALSYGDYDSFGHATTIQSGAALADSTSTDPVVSDSYTYDDIGQLTSHLLADDAGTSLLDLTLDWNAFRQIDTITDAVDASQSQSFTYDEVGRLASASGSYGDLDYDYEPGGNLITAGGVTYDYQGHQIISGASDGSTVFTAAYDGAGNLESRTDGTATTEYDWDAWNRLAGVGDVAFDYDETGRRWRKNDGSITTLYVAGSYEVASDDEGNAQHTVYLKGPLGVMASVTVVDTGSGISTGGVPEPGTRYLHLDHIGSTILQTDESGSVVDQLVYEPFGALYAGDDSSSPRQKFTGKELDSGSGLYYFEARYYDPALGRFLSADTVVSGRLERADVHDRYAYVLNDPVNRTDPTGHFSLGHAWKSVKKGVKKAGKSIGKAVTSQTGEIVLSSVVDGAEIAGGAALIIGTGGAGSAVGAGLLSAGVAGAEYTATHTNNFSWKDYGITEGVGFASGLVGGAVGELGAAALGGGLAASVAVGAASGAASAATSTELNNWANHKSWSSGLASSVAGGALWGGIGGAVGAGVAKGFGSATESTDISEGFFSDTSIESSSNVSSVDDDWGFSTTKDLTDTTRFKSISFAADQGVGGLNMGFDAATQSKGGWVDWLK